MSDIKYSAIPAFNANDDQTSRLQAGVALAVNPVLSALSSSQMVLTQTPGFAAVGAAAMGARVVNPTGGPGNVGAYVAMVSGPSNAGFEIHGDGSPSAQTAIDFASSPTVDYDWRLTESPDNNLQIFQSAASLATGRAFYVNAPMGTQALNVGGAFTAPTASFRQAFFGGTFNFSSTNGQSAYLQYLLPGGAGTNADVPMPFAGSIVAISLKFAAGSQGGAGVNVFVDTNGGGTGANTGGFNTGGAGTNTFRTATFAKNSVRFNAGDILTARIQNVSGNPAAITLLGEVTFWVETAP